jgi:hypothetical protein
MVLLLWKYEWSCEFFTNQSRHRRNPEERKEGEVYELVNIAINLYLYTK